MRSSCTQTQARLPKAQQRRLRCNSNNSNSSSRQQQQQHVNGNNNGAGTTTSALTGGFHSQPFSSSSGVVYSGNQAAVNNVPLTKQEGFARVSSGLTENSQLQREFSHRSHRSSVGYSRRTEDDFGKLPVTL